MNPIVMHRHAPFLIVVAYVLIKPETPGASDFFGHCNFIFDCHDLFLDLSCV